MLDDEEDRFMDFYEAFSPIFVLIGLFVTKVAMIKEDFQATKCVLAGFLILLASTAETYFDKDLENNVSPCILALPISGILVCQAILDFLFYMKSTNRVFYCLNNPLKKVWILGNCGATLIYSICLYRWLWILQTSDNAKALGLAMGTFIFYAIFLIERIGTYILSISHE